MGDFTKPARKLSLSRNAELRIYTVNMVTRSLPIKHSLNTRVPDTVVKARGNGSVNNGIQKGF